VLEINLTKVITKRSFNLLSIKLSMYIFFILDIYIHCNILDHLLFIYIVHKNKFTAKLLGEDRNWNKKAFEEIGK